MRLFTPPNKDELTAGFCGEKMEAGTTAGALREDIEVCSVRDAGALLGENIACRCIAVSRLELDGAEQVATKDAGTF